MYFDAHWSMCSMVMCTLLPNFLPPPVVLLFWHLKQPMKASASLVIKLYAGIDINYAAALMNLISKHWIYNEVSHTSSCGQSGS